MGFQGVAYLSSRASYSTTFLKNCVRGESLRTTTCPKTVVGGKPGHVKYLCSTKPLSISVEFSGDHKTATKMR